MESSLSEIDWVAVINTAQFLAFFSGIILIVIRLIIRADQYRRARWQQPELLRRDMILFAGLVLSFGLVLSARVFGWAPFIQGQVWWNLLTGIPAVVGVWYWAYYEFFRVDKPRR